MPRSPLLSHSVTESLLEALADPDASLNSVARRFNISLGALTIWLARPETQARVREMESGAHTHVRLAASLNLSAAVRTLTRILDDFDALARTHADSAARAADPAYIRCSDRARKAAYHLYRLSRIVPIDTARVAAARALVEAESSRVACLRKGQACEPTHAPSPSQSHGCVLGGAAMPPDRASASSAPLRIETSSPSVALRELRGESCSSPRPSAALRVESSSSPTDSPSVSLCLGGESSSDLSPRPSESSASSAFSSLDELNAELESLANSLGIDTSDFDVDTPLPPEFLALFPPEVAAFLAQPPDPPDPHISPPDRAPAQDPSLASV